MAAASEGRQRRTKATVFSAPSGPVKLILRALSARKQQQREQKTETANENGNTSIGFSYAALRHKRPHWIFISEMSDVSLEHFAFGPLHLSQLQISITAGYGVEVFGCAAILTPIFNKSISTLTHSIMLLIRKILRHLSLLQEETTVKGNEKQEFLYPLKSVL